MSPINGSGLMEAVLVLPSFVPESRTTSTEINTVSTSAISFCLIGAQKPGMISPVINAYLLFARYQNEKNKDIKMIIFV